MFVSEGVRGRPESPREKRTSVFKNKTGCAFLHSPVMSDILEKEEQTDAHCGDDEHCDNGCSCGELGHPIDACGVGLFGLLAENHCCSVGVAAVDADAEHTCAGRLCLCGGLILRVVAEGAVDLRASVGIEAEDTAVAQAEPCGDS